MLIFYQRYYLWDFNFFMKTLTCLIFLLPLLVFSQNYPASKKTPDTITHQNITYIDDYTWLENMRSEEVDGWVNAQNKIYNSHINSLSSKVYPLPIITKYENQTNYHIPNKKRAYYYSGIISYGNEMQTASLGYKKKIDDNYIELVNPNFFYPGKTVNIIGYEPSINSKVLAYKLMIDGSDQHEIRFVTIKNGKKLDDVINKSKFGGIAWKGDEGIFYSKNENSEQFAVDSTYKVYYHKLHTDVKDDKVIFDAKANESQINYFNSDNGETFFLKVINKAETRADYYYADLKEEVPELKILMKDIPLNIGIVGYNHNEVFITTAKANWGDLQSFKIENPSVKNVIIPEYHNELLVNFYFFENRIVCKYKSTSGNHLKLFDYNGRFIKKIQVPAGTDVNVSGNDFFDEEIFFSISSYTVPPILFTLTLKDGSYSRFVNKAYTKTTAPFPLDYFTTKNESYTTRDGVEVAITIVHKKDIKQDGTNPTLLKAYGGFGSINNPSYDNGLIYFLNNGGVYAYAEIRGGGEKGLKWHKDGMGLKKINTFNDFIDAAEYLIEQGYTSPDKLAITGGSQGGLLVGVAMTKRPELFKVAIPKVGVYDMAKFHNYTIGRFHYDEYGNPENKEEFAAMMDYSPYHNIKEDVNYPTTLIITSDNDDRVPPVHSYKFAAKVIADDDIAKNMNDLPDSLKPIVKGGGSLTALPIIETQAGDVSAYIPTNVISITDGQIFLESDLFNSGVRPAINVGISVSRVGGNAQIKSMKKVAGTLKLDQAQFRELEAFAKFGSDLDAATLNVIEKGKRNVEILKQAVNDPFTVENQVAIIYAGSRNLLKNVPVDKVKEFERDYIEYLNAKHRDTLDALKAGKFTDELTDVLEKAAAEISAKY